MRLVSPVFLTPSRLGLFTAILLLLGAPTLPAEEVEFRYLGNEGFMVSRGEDVVLIDALFGEGVAGYSVVPRKIRKNLKKARGDYAEVDLVLASHFHPDHFEAEAVVEHLEANPGAHFLGPGQTTDRVVALEEELRPRVLRLWPDSGEKLDYEHRGIHLTAVRLHHGAAPAQNLGWIVEMGGLRWLHFGDTEITAEEIRPLGLREEGIDVALLPYWYFDTAQWQPVLEEIGARHLVAMHLAVPEAPGHYFGEAGSLEKQMQVIREAAPGVWIPQEPLETRTFSALKE